MAKRFLLSQSEVAGVDSSEEDSSEEESSANTYERDGFVVSDEEATTSDYSEEQEAVFHWRRYMGKSAKKASSPSRSSNRIKRQNKTGNVSNNQKETSAAKAVTPPRLNTKKTAVDSNSDKSLSEDSDTEEPFEDPPLLKRKGEKVSGKKGRREKLSKYRRRHPLAESSQSSNGESTTEDDNDETEEPSQHTQKVHIENMNALEKAGTVKAKEDGKDTEKDNNPEDERKPPGVNRETKKDDDVPVGKEEAGAIQGLQALEIIDLTDDDAVGQMSNILLDVFATEEEPEKISVTDKFMSQMGLLKKQNATKFSDPLETEKLLMLHMYPELPRVLQIERLEVEGTTETETGPPPINIVVRHRDSVSETQTLCNIDDIKVGLQSTVYHLITCYLDSIASNTERDAKLQASKELFGYDAVQRLALKVKTTAGAAVICEEAKISGKSLFVPAWFILDTEKVLRNRKSFWSYKNVIQRFSDRIQVIDRYITEYMSRKEQGDSVKQFLGKKNWYAIRDKVKKANRNSDKHKSDNMARAEMDRILCMGPTTGCTGDGADSLGTFLNSKLTDGKFLDEMLNMTEFVYKQAVDEGICTEDEVADWKKRAEDASPENRPHVKVYKIPTKGLIGNKLAKFTDNYEDGDILYTQVYVLCNVLSPGMDLLYPRYIDHGHRDHQQRLAHMQSSTKWDYSESWIRGSSLHPKPVVYCMLGKGGNSCLYTCGSCDENDAMDSLLFAVNKWLNRMTNEHLKNQFVELERKNHNVIKEFQKLVTEQNTFLDCIDEDVPPLHFAQDNQSYEVIGKVEGASYSKHVDSDEVVCDPVNRKLPADGHGLPTMYEMKTNTFVSSTAKKGPTELHVYPAGYDKVVIPIPNCCVHGQGSVLQVEGLCIHEVKECKWVKDAKNGEVVSLERVPPAIGIKSTLDLKYARYNRTFRSARCEFRYGKNFDQHFPSGASRSFDPKYRRVVRHPLHIALTGQKEVKRSKKSLRKTKLGSAMGATVDLTGEDNTVTPSIDASNSTDAESLVSVTPESTEVNMTEEKRDMMAKAKLWFKSNAFGAAGACYPSLPPTRAEEITKCKSSGRRIRAVEPLWQSLMSPAAFQELGIRCCQLYAEKEDGEQVSLQALLDQSLAQPGMKYKRDTARSAIGVTVSGRAQLTKRTKTDFDWSSIPSLGIQVTNGYKAFLTYISETRGHGYFFDEAKDLTERRMAFRESFEKKCTEAGAVTPAERFTVGVSMIDEFPVIKELTIVASGGCDIVATQGNNRKQMEEMADSLRAVPSGVTLVAADNQSMLKLMERRSAFEVFMNHADYCKGLTNPNTCKYPCPSLEEIIEEEHRRTGSDGKFDSGRQLNQEPQERRLGHTRSATKKRKHASISPDNDDNVEQQIVEEVEESAVEGPREIDMVHIGTFYVSKSISYTGPMSPFFRKAQKDRLKTNGQQYLTWMDSGTTLFILTEVLGPMHYIQRYAFEGKFDHVLVKMKRHQHVSIEIPASLSTAQFQAFKFDVNNNVRMLVRSKFSTQNENDGSICWDGGQTAEFGGRRVQQEQAVDVEEAADGNGVVSKTRVLQDTATDEDHNPVSGETLDWAVRYGVPRFKDAIFHQLPVDNKFLKKYNGFANHLFQNYYHMKGNVENFNLRQVMQKGTDPDVFDGEMLKLKALDGSNIRLTVKQHILLCIMNVFAGVRRFRGESLYDGEKKDKPVFAGPLPHHDKVPMPLSSLMRPLASLSEHIDPGSLLHYMSVHFPRFGSENWCQFNERQPVDINDKIYDSLDSIEAKIGYRNRALREAIVGAFVVRTMGNPSFYRAYRSLYPLKEGYVDDVLGGSTLVLLPTMEELEENGTFSDFVKLAIVDYDKVKFTEEGEIQEGSSVKEMDERLFSRGGTKQHSGEIPDFLQRASGFLHTIQLLLNCLTDRFFEEHLYSPAANEKFDHEKSAECFIKVKDFLKGQLFPSSNKKSLVGSFIIQKILEDVRRIFIEPFGMVYPDPQIGRSDKKKYEADLSVYFGSGATGGCECLRVCMDEEKEQEYQSRLADYNKLQQSIQDEADHVEAEASTHPQPQPKKKQVKRPRRAFSSMFDVCSNFTKELMKMDERVFAAMGYKMVKVADLSETEEMYMLVSTFNGTILGLLTIENGLCKSFSLVCAAHPKNMSRIRKQYDRIHCHPVPDHADYTARFGWEVSTSPFKAFLDQYCDEIQLAILDLVKEKHEVVDPANVPECARCEGEKLVPFARNDDEDEDDGMDVDGS